MLSPQPLHRAALQEANKAPNQANGFVGSGHHLNSSNARKLLGAKVTISVPYRSARAPLSTQPPTFHLRLSLSLVCLWSRLLKISGRLLQAAVNLCGRVDKDLRREHSSDSYPASQSSGAPSPLSALRPGNHDEEGRQASSDLPYANGTSVHPEPAAAVGTGDEGVGHDEEILQDLRKYMVELPSPTRLDFANRFLEVRRSPPCFM